MKQLEVQIMQQSYLLGCPEGREARLLDAVERVDTAMTRIRDAGKVRARERIAVLAALNLAFELADREAAELAAAVQPSAPTPASTEFGPDADHSGILTGEDERLQALVRRLDEALGNDGRLI
ncbi:MAG: cell division protein ZapA [Verminephrobacter sp.]|nr:cell division protein ZapA [Verminephrobacter sp.]